MATQTSFDPPAALCEGLRRMFDTHGDEIEQAVAMMEAVQFERFMATSPKDEKAREDVYFSVLGAKEFHAFLMRLASQAPSLAGKPQEWP